MLNTQNGHYTLFSFRRCPYAMRARLAFVTTQTPFEIIEVSLKNKPEKLLELSPKATVPVLWFHETKKNKESPACGKTQVHEFIIEESLDIMLHLLSKSSHDWIDYTEVQHTISLSLIEQNDSEFKYHLDRYKYANRYTSDLHDQEKLRFSSEQKALCFIEILEKRLHKKEFLIQEKPTLADQAIFPFIRQFHRVREDLLHEHGFSKTINWLKKLTEQPEFKLIMEKKFQGINPQDRLFLT